MISLPERWSGELASQPETGMGYQIVSVILHDGRRFDQAVVVDGAIAEIRGLADIPFAREEIAQIVVTHDKWNFGARN